MKILIVFAHPNRKSFCHAVLEQFTQGLKDAGHTYEVVDLYAIRFDPVFRTQDFASYVHESMPPEILEPDEPEAACARLRRRPDPAHDCRALAAG